MPGLTHPCPSLEGCPEGGVGQIYDYRYPIYHG